MRENANVIETYISGVRAAPNLLGAGPSAQATVMALLAGRAAGRIIRDAAPTGEFGSVPRAGIQECPPGQAISESVWFTKEQRSRRPDHRQRIPPRL